MVWQLGRSWRSFKDQGSNEGDAIDDDADLQCSPCAAGPGPSPVWKHCPCPGTPRCDLEQGGWSFKPTISLAQADLACPAQQCQGHEHGAEEKARSLQQLQEERTKLRKAVYSAMAIMLVEIVGGLLANSLAIITDAAHMLSDVGSFAVALACLQLSASACTEEYTFGFKQAEVLGALLSIMVVWTLTIMLLSHACHRMYHLEEIDGPVMLWVSLFGFLVNLLLMKILGHNHSHGGQPCTGHGHAHGIAPGLPRSQANETEKDSLALNAGVQQVIGHPCDGHPPGAACGLPESETQERDRQQSLAMKAAIVHVVGDIVQSLGVCLAALCIWWQPFDLGVTDKGVSRWNYADPLCTVLFGILVLFTTKATFTKTINNLMMKAPSHVDQRRLKEELSACPGVASVHDLRVWTLGSNDVLCTAHLRVIGREGAIKEALEAAKAVAARLGVAQATFQPDILSEEEVVEVERRLKPQP